MLRSGERELLKAYEDTGITPEQMWEIDRLYREKCEEVAELRRQLEKVCVNTECCYNRKTACPAAEGCPGFEQEEE